MQEKQKALLKEIISKVNDLFGADTTDGDYVRVPHFHAFGWMSQRAPSKLNSDHFAAMSSPVRKKVRASSFVAILVTWRPG